ncbi:MAG: hypothetical protein L0Z68_08365 [Gammaproteobacteria bacterium]|nr:hypothetical protein [Gammaproteobacteria bacterium]
MISGFVWPKPYLGEMLNEPAIEFAVGGAYRMDDGREFWVDATVAREIARRIVSREVDIQSKCSE